MPEEPLLQSHLGKLAAQGGRMLMSPMVPAHCMRCGGMGLLAPDLQAVRCHSAASADADLCSAAGACPQAPGQGGWPGVADSPSTTSTLVSNLQTQRQRAPQHIWAASVLLSPNTWGHKPRLGWQQRGGCPVELRIPA